MVEELIPSQLVTFMPFTMIFLFMFSLCFAILRKNKLFVDNKNAAVLICLALAFFTATSTLVIDFFKVLTVQLGMFLIAGLFLILAVFSFFPKMEGFGSWILIPVILIFLAIAFNSYSQVTGSTQTFITMGGNGLNVLGISLSPENITLLIIIIVVLVFIAWAYRGGKSGGREFKIKLFE